MISTKLDNEKYAPGIATYGIAGKAGNEGQPGNSIFYTSFDLLNNLHDDLTQFKNQIIMKHLPVKNSQTVLTREYQDGDYFFDQYGNIFHLYNIDGLIHESSNSDVYSKYFKLVGKINTNTADSYVHYSNASGRLVINSSYKGLDVVTTNGNNPIANRESSFGLRIISDSIDDNSIIPLISNVALYGQSENIYFDICYDTKTEAFFFKSNKPIVMDGNVTVQNSNSADTDVVGQYSPVLTTDNPITSFYNFCQKVSYSATFNEEDAGKLTTIAFEVEGVNAGDYVDVYTQKYFERVGDNVKVKIEYTDESTTKGYINGTKTSYYIAYLKDAMTFSPFSGVDESNSMYKFWKYAHEESDVSIVNVSLIYNIEVFIKEKEG